MRKWELEQLLKHIVDICDGKIDPYEEDSMRQARIHDLAAQAVDVKEWIPGAFLMPRFKKLKD